MEVREKSLAEFYRDISSPTGTPTGMRSVRLEKRQDPVLQLRRPLAFYEDRVFFYAGLLYGFCRLDASVTERFREASGSDVRTEMYLLQHPLVEVQGFPGFARTQVAHLLSAIETGPLQQPFFDFLASQLIVDRKRQLCWRCRLETVTLHDPYLVDADESPVDVVLPMFVPYQHDQVYAPVSTPGGTPVVRRILESDPALLQEQVGVLGG